MFLLGSERQGSVGEPVLTFAEKGPDRRRWCHIVQVASHLTGTTAHVTHFAAPGDLSCEAIEEFSIKRLVLKFVENSACIFARE